MAASPLSVPGAKATLFLSLGLSMLGVTGMVVGYSQLRAHTGPAMSVSDRVPAEHAEQLRAVEDEVRASTLPEAAATANLLVSLLLVIASMTLTSRRASALWWTRQAVLANMAYTVFATGAQLHQLWTYGAVITLLATSVAEADPAGPPPPEVTAMIPWLAAAMTVAIGLVMLALYMGLFFLARRADVGRFVRREP